MNRGPGGADDAGAGGGGQREDAAATTGAPVLASQEDAAVAELKENAFADIHGGAAANRLWLPWRGSCNRRCLLVRGVQQRSGQAGWRWRPDFQEGVCGEVDERERLDPLGRRRRRLTEGQRPLPLSR